MNLVRGNLSGGMLVVLLLAGCRHGAPTGTGTGHASFQVMEPRRPPPPVSSGKERLEPLSRGQYRDAQAVHPLVMPVYPPKALAARAGMAQVGVHVNIDATGVVADIQPSLLAISIVPPKFGNDFREAVEAAVRQWRFIPAQVHHLETRTEGGFTYDHVVRTEATEAEFDLLFTFTTSGKVEMGGAK